MIYKITIMNTYEAISGIGIREEVWHVAGDKPHIAQNNLRSYLRSTYIVNSCESLDTVEPPFIKQQPPFYNKQQIIFKNQK